MIGGAAIVVAYQSSLPDPGDVQNGASAENMVVYSMIVVVSLLFGMAEVLYDNSAQTILPAIVKPEGLERANGNLWGAEMVTNSFVGPPLGSLLIGMAFAYPFFFDGGTFVVAAVLIYLISGNFKTKDSSEAQSKEKVDWWAEIKEGVTWLWAHPLLRPMAIILGLMNGLGAVTFATLVLFAQEVLGTDAFVFAILGMSGAVGGIIGSLVAPQISKRLGSGTSLHFTLAASSITSFVIGFATHWSIVWVMFATFSFTAVLWNVITVSLRQTIIPDELLGRVNSVYRFFAWGMMPIGLLIGGLLVSTLEGFGASRDVALRSPWWFAGAAYVALFAYAAPKLTTSKIEAAREEGVASKATAARVESEGVDDPTPVEADGADTAEGDSED